MSKKNIIIATISTFTLLILVGLGVGILPFLIDSNLQKTITNWETNKTEIKVNGMILGNYQNGATFDSFSKEFYKQQQFVISKPDLFNPVISLVREDKCCDEYKKVTIDIYHLKRTGINSFELHSYSNNTIRNRSYQQALEIAKKYDLTKTNPDPANITVFPAPSREEVQRQKDSQKKLEDMNAINQSLQNQFEEVLKKSTAEQLVFTKAYRAELEKAIAKQKQNPNQTIDFYGIQCTPERQKDSNLFCAFDKRLVEINKSIIEIESKSK